MASTAKLTRHITLWPLVLYGMGDILGAGIYGLIGKAAGLLGNSVWMGFLISMIAAGFTGLSYASLGSRYPHSGGASYITHKAYNGFVAYVVGLAVLASGLTSMATACRVFSGYFVGLAPFFSTEIVIVLFALALAGLIFVGIRETMWVNSIMAGVEILGLLLILVFGFSYLGQVDYLSAVTQDNPNGNLSVPLLLGGAVLTFYSFIGFEDMLNVSEEVVKPESTLPKALLMAVGASSVIYVLISLVAVSVVPAPELAASPQPLVEVVRRAAPWFPSSIYSVIAMFAVANTALLNFVMGSRLLYGMSGQGLVPQFLGKVHHKRSTPHRAILVLLVLLLLLAFAGDIAALAKATSVLLLCCFVLVNGALLVMKRKDKKKGKLEVPDAVPVCGLLVCLAMLSQAQIHETLIAGGIIVGIMVMYFVLRPKEGAIWQLKD